MTEPKQFKRGRRTYTRMGNFKEVRIEGNKPKSETGPETKPATLEIDAATETGVYSNQSTVYRSNDEVVMDFGFVTASHPRGRVRSRVVVSHKHARELAQMLKKASEDPS